jgi:hyperosmotically inducible protein
MTKRFLCNLALCLALITTTLPLHAAEKVTTDDAIYDHVKEKLAIDQIVKGGALDIEVKDGVVTIKGKVDSEKRKEKAAKIAKKVAGVKSVDNQIVVSK